jgi:[FeFe] hydrogenase H-cluster maturation GTPase HydF
MNNISRLHIGLFGRRNTGKSSVINCLTGQDLSIVSNIAGTTTDPVKKSVEIPALGAVVLVDTAGIDDAGELGEKRTAKTRQSFKQVDMAIVVLCNNHFDSSEQQLTEQLQRLQIPFVFLHNKSDETPSDPSFVTQLTDRYKVDFIDFSAKTGKNLDELLLLLQKNVPDDYNKLPPLFGDMLKTGDMVLLITPIDSEAPARRMILPQVQAIREALDFNCIAVVLKETEVDDFMAFTSIIPSLVITDSQLFGKIETDKRR